MKKKIIMIKPLVSKGNDIIKEENNLHLKIENDYKKEIKKTYLKNRNKLLLTHSEPTSIKNTLKISKYPIDKKSYESQLKSFEESKSVKDNDNEDDIYYNEDNIIQLGDNY